MDLRHIEGILSRFAPRPSRRFYERMEGAPWHDANQNENWRSTLRRRSLLALPAALLVLATLWIAFPPVQTMARQISEFFKTGSWPIEQAASTGPRAFDLSIEAAQQAANFALVEPGRMPPGYRFGGAEFDGQRNAAIFNYRHPNGLLRFTQSMNPAGTEIARIGPDALIETTAIHFLGLPIEGEYVSGAWQLPPFDSVLPQSQPDIPPTLEARWNPDARIQMLRWESAGILYELIHGEQDAGLLTLDAIIHIAESMHYFDK